MEPPQSPGAARGAPHLPPTARVASASIAIPPGRPLVCCRFSSRRPLVAPHVRHAPARRPISAGGGGFPRGPAHIGDLSPSLGQRLPPGRSFRCCIPYKRGRGRLPPGEPRFGSASPHETSARSHCPPRTILSPRLIGMIIESHRRPAVKSRLGAYAPSAWSRASRDEDKSMEIR